MKQKFYKNKTKFHTAHAILVEGLIKYFK